MSPEVEDIFRIIIVVAGLVGAFTNWYLVWYLRSKVNYMIKLRMIGGGLLCLAVALGCLSELLGLSNVWRLPFLVAALVWVAAGGVGQIWHIWKLRKEGYTYKKSSDM